LNHLDPRLRGSSPSSSSELPRFDLPGESARTGRFDAADAAATNELPVVRRGSRPAIRKIVAAPKSADSTDEVAVDQILLETYLETPKPRRPATPPPMPVFVPPPPAPSQLAAVDALLEQSASPASVAPVALSVPVPPPAPIYVQDAHTGKGAGAVAWVAMFGVFAIAAAASLTLLAKPETLARVRDGIRNELVPAAPPHAIAAPLPVHVVVPTATATAPVAPPVPTLSVTALPKPVVEANMTLVTLPPYAAGHRVFVDGVAAASSGTTLKARCGRHAIKIGSTGKGRTLDLPCGGELILK
jgi:hypothetical protein